MESFAKLMCALGASQCGIDFIDSLPVEIAELILRSLDLRSLLNVAQVSRKWMAVCKGDSRLRRTARHHLRKEKRRMTHNNGSGSKQSKPKGQATCRAVRMQADLAQRLSRQGHAAPPLVSLVFRATGANTIAPALKNLSTSTKPSRVPRIPTRSFLKLR